MARKIIGVVLLIAAGLLAFLLISSGRIFPHLVGPVALAITGLVLITRKGAHQSDT